VKRSYRPLLITIGALAGFTAVGVAIGRNGWGTPAANEQAIGEISRWCERVSGGLLREPVNTLGNLGFVVAGLLMFWILGRDTARNGTAPNRFVVLTPSSTLYAAAVVFLGPGSMVMHGTHTFFGAWLDNVSMVAYITIPWLLNLAELGRWPNRRFFTVYTAVIAAYAAGYWFLGPDLGVGLELFKVSIPLWIISETLYRWWSPRARWMSGFVGFVVAAAFGITPVTMARHPGEYWWFFLFWLPGLLATHPATGLRRYTPWFWGGVASFMLAYAVWLTGNPDSRWCHPDSLIQAHAIWHLLTALATWCFFMFLRTERPTGSKPAVGGGGRLGAGAG
jgi:hypothetical protein